jgi:short-subunit dehydrogenase
VVNVVSVAGTVAFPPSGPYCAAKHAQAAFSRATAAELDPRGIRVHTIHPGFVHTEGFPNRDRFPGALRRLVLRPEEVAEHVLATLDNGRVETFVPWWYRPAAIVQGAFPGLLVRALARRYRSRIGS